MNRLLIRRWYEDHGPALLLYARSVAGELASAEDAVQGVFVKLLEGRAPAPADPRPYLFRAVRNAVVDEKRRGVKRSDLHEEPWFEAREPDEGAERLQDAIAELPADQREVVVLKTWGDLTFAEIAGLLGIPANTAASRWRYGLEKLKALMTESEA